MTSTTPSVSDVRREAVETEGFDPKDDSAVPVRQTPFPTSPLNEGAVEEARFDEIVDWLKWRSEIAAGNDNADACKSFADAAQLLTTLLTNLAKAQRERDEAKSLASRMAVLAFRHATTVMRMCKEAEAAESRLSHLQTRLEEVEGALEPYARLHPASFGAIVAAMSSRFETLKGTRSGAAAYYDLEAIKTMADGHQRARAALQPKGESK